MYQAGEFIVYGTSGVCEVTAVGQPAFARVIHFIPPRKYG